MTKATFLVYFRSRLAQVAGIITPSQFAILNDAEVDPHTMRILIFALIKTDGYSAELDWLSSLTDQNMASVYTPDPQMN